MIIIETSVILTQDAYTITVPKTQWDFACLLSSIAKEETKVSQIKLFRTAFGPDFSLRDAKLIVEAAYQNSIPY